MTGILPSAKAAQAEHLSMANRLGRRGYGVFVVFVASVGLWVTTASISGAVVSTATFVAETNAKKVQHPFGGVVSAVMVREGDHVPKGAVLLRLDETAVRSNLQIILKQIDEALMRSGRLEAERDGATRFDAPEWMGPRQNERELSLLHASENRLFQARTAARAGLQAQLSKRLTQLGREMAGLQQQMAARSREAEINKRELNGIRDLFKRNLVTLNRVSTLEREAASLEGARGQLSAQIEQLEAKVAETELQIVQLGEDHRAEVTRELRETEARLAELSEKRKAAQDQFARLDVRAPASGHVHQLAIHAPGAVINPSEAILQIVPSDEPLSLEARVNPGDYDQLRLGQEAMVRLHAFNQRTTPELRGIVSRLAPDVTRDAQTGATYYTIRVTIPAAELERLAPLAINAGMQAETLIQTGDRTPASYLIKPLRDQIARAFRER